MEVTFRFRKELLERAKRKAESSGTTIEDVVIRIIERIAAGEELDDRVWRAIEIPDRQRNFEVRR